MLIQTPEPDSDLVRLANAGSTAALTELLRRHQSWLYNLAVRMVGRRDEAEDVLQDVFAKVVAELPGFRCESSFRTWVYRITTNHVINLAKRPRELAFSSFDSYGRMIDEAPDSDMDDLASPVEADLLVRETKLQCMMGMLLCLDRTQRLAFIAALLGAGSDVGSAMLDISAEGYRQTLSRARRQLACFMSDRCSLIREGNPCRCARKTRAAIAAGYVDPTRLQFAAGHVRLVREIAEPFIDHMDDLLGMRPDELFREHPFLEAPDCVSHLLRRMPRG